MSIITTEAQIQNKTVKFVKQNKNQPQGKSLTYLDNNDLWLEKYKPKKYDDLLTEEKTNRDILTWLKSWDELVFKVKQLSKSRKKSKST